MEQTQKRLSRMEKDLSDIESMTRSLINFQGKQFKEEIGIMRIKGAQAFWYDLDGLVVRGWRCGLGRRGTGAA